VPAADCSQSCRECDEQVPFMFKTCFWFWVVFFVFWNLLLIFHSSVQLTALHLGASYGHAAVCRLLIAAKADVNATDMCAFVFEICYCYSFWYFLALFSRVATHPPACSDGDTPLKLAINKNKRKVVAFLRSVGAEEWALFSGYSPATHDTRLHDDAVAAADGDAINRCDGIPTTWEK
jgi:hypothetical protein